MDKTEQFIKMADCPEIQEQKPKGGNEISCYITSLPLHVHISKYGDYWEGSKHLIWLPRQDQIQEMMRADKEDKFSNWLLKLEEFTHIIQPWDIPIDKSGLKTIGWLETWEQLWLAFYMWGKHKKIWDGEKWLHNQQGGKDAIEL